MGVSGRVRLAFLDSAPNKIWVLERGAESNHRIKVWQILKETTLSSLVSTHGRAAPADSGFASLSQSFGCVHIGQVSAESVAVIAQIGRYLNRANPFDTSSVARLKLLHDFSRTSLDVDAVQL